MTQEHPITPPPELVEQWLNAPRYAKSPKDGTFVVQKCHSLSESEVITLVENAARWGADEELQACINWLYENGWGQAVDGLRAARRPKPSSLKEEALQALDLLKVDASTHGLGFNSSAIRRALESLPD